MASGFVTQRPRLGFTAAFLWIVFRSLAWLELVHKPRRRRLSYRRKLMEDAASGHVHSIICESTRLFDFSEVEDEGAFYIFDGGDGHYLALAGQRFYETDRFPSELFEIIRGAKSQTLLTIRPRGRKLEPTTLLSIQKYPPIFLQPAHDITLFDAPPGADVAIILNQLATLDRRTIPPP